MFEMIAEAGLAILTGGATGLLGTAITGVMAFFQERQRHAQEMDLRRLDIDLARTEAAAAENVAAIEAEREGDRTDAAILTASYEEAARRWSRSGDGWLMQLVDAVRGLTRPALTWALVALVAAIYFLLGASDEVDAIRARIIDTVLYLATAAVLWWFGARQVAKGTSRAQGAS